MLQPVLLKYYHKKILSEILRVLNRIAARPHKRENGPPISPAKLGERIASFLLFTPESGSRKDQAPAGSDKLTRFASTLLTRLSVHERTLWFSLIYTSIKC